MVTTVTTTTTTTVTTVAAASLVLIAVITLLILLIQKEVLSNLERGGERAWARNLSRALNVAIVPLAIVFIVACIVSIADVLR